MGNTQKSKFFFFIEERGNGKYTHLFKYFFAEDCLFMIKINLERSLKRK